MRNWERLDERYEKTFSGVTGAVYAGLLLRFLYADLGER